MCDAHVITNEYARVGVAHVAACLADCAEAHAHTRSQQLPTQTWDDDGIGQVQSNTTKECEHSVYVTGLMRAQSGVRKNHADIVNIKAWLVVLRGTLNSNQHIMRSTTKAQMTGKLDNLA